MVAWIDGTGGTAQVRALKYNGSSWQSLGSGTTAIPSDPDAHNLALATDGTDVAIAWVHGAGSVRVLEWAGTAWAPAGSGGIGGMAASGASSPTLAFYSGSLFAAWLGYDGDYAQVYAAEFNGSAWSPAGAGAASGGGVSNSTVNATSPELAASAGGLILGWSDVWDNGASAHDVLYVKQWDGSSFSEKIAGDAEAGGISTTSGTILSLALAIDPAGKSFVAWNQGASGSPSIYVVGNPAQAARTFYVNGGGSGGFYTTVPGDPANSGLSPSAPLATIQQVLDDFTLLPGDVILIDAGAYAVPDAFAGDAAGVTVIGAPNGTTTLEPSAPLAPGDGLTFQDVTLAGGLFLTGGSGFTLRDSAAGLVSIEGGSGALLTDDVMATLSITNGAVDTDVEKNTIGGEGVVIDGAAGLTLRDNTITAQAGFDGITIEAASDGVIAGNIITSSETVLDIAAPFGGSITGNSLTGGTIGLDYGAAAAVGGNQIFGNTTGVLATVIGTAAAFGFVGPADPNSIYGNTTGVDLLGQMQGQDIFENSTGVIGDGTLGGSDFSNPNVIEDNGLGVDFAGTIQFNQITRNTIGVEVVPSTGQGGNTADGHLIAHNIFDLNTQTGLNLSGVSDIRLFSNTFYSKTGDNIDITGKTSEVDIENNTLWANGGYDIEVDNDSQSGFYSDYNDLIAGPDGKLVYWTMDFTDLLDWQDDVAEFDLHSIGTTVINPTGEQPQFVNFGAGDLSVFPVVDGQRASSPTVGLGDPIADQGLPAGSPNLLTNPSFESGLTGWTTNPGSSATSSAPAGAPFDGSSVFYAGSVADGSALQTVNLLAAGYTAAQLDGGGLFAVFSGRVRTAAEASPDLGKITMRFLDGSGNVISSTTVQAQGASDRWELLGGRVAVPVGTRSIQYLFEAVRISGSTDDASLDNAVLKLEPEGVETDLGASADTAADLAPVVVPHIVLHTPYLYVDAIQNAPIVITWNTYGNTSNLPIRIDLYQDGINGPAYWKTIAAGAPDTGSYTWTPFTSGVNFGTYGLRVEVSIVGDPVAFDRGVESFTVPENTPTFYVNDGSTTGDVYTKAIGSNRNDGRLATAPKPNPVNILRVYSIGPTDTLYIDTGDYPLIDPIVLSGTLGIGDDRGFIMTGPTNPADVATLTNAIPGSTTPLIELNNADFMTIDDLTLAGGSYGVWGFNGSTNFAGSNLVATNQTIDGFRFESGTTVTSLTGVSAIGAGRSGIDDEGTIQSIAGSVVEQSGGTGIVLPNPGVVAITDTVSAYNGGDGIDISSSNGLATVGSTNLAAGLGNMIHDNAGNGIFASGNVLIAGNTVDDNTSGTGIVVQGATATDNVVFGNDNGILANSYGAVVTDNRVYDNAGIGIHVYLNTLVQGNTVYSNTVGIQADIDEYTHYSGTIANNVVYDNTEDGIVLNSGGGDLVVNNTLDEVVGDAIVIDASSYSVDLINNILWAQSGYDINVASDSQNGFQSDYNLLYVTGTGQVGLWQNVARSSLTAWQNADFTDENSLSQDPMFVDPAGPDGNLGYVSPASDGRDDDFHAQSLYGSDHGGSLAPVVSFTTGLPAIQPGTFAIDANQSPAIDRGSPTTSFSNEPAPNGGYVNIGAYGNTNEASKSPQSYVLVTKPGGGEVWPQGQTFPILWRSALATENALSLNGSSQYVEVPSSPSLDSASLTVEGWFNFASAGGAQVLISKAAGTGTSSSFAVWYDGRNLNAVIGGPNGNGAVISFAWSPPVGTWHEIAFSFDAGSQTEVLYLDGVAVASGNSGRAIQYDSSPVLLGAQSQNSTLGNWFSGLIDEVRFWTSALPQTTIQANMNRALAGTESGLDAYYTFDTETSGTSPDLTGHGNTAIFGGSVVTAEPIRVPSHAPLSTVNIDLVAADGTTVVENIATDVLNDGEFLWAIPESLAPGNYFVRVTRPDVPGLSGISESAFTVTLPIHTYYVATAKPSGDPDWATAPGNDGNSGLDAADPKASISAVLAAYKLGPGDIIKVDAGTYELSTNIVLNSSSSGYTIQGYDDTSNPLLSTILDRGNTNYGSYAIELDGATNVTIANVGVTGGYDGLYADQNAASTGLTVTGSSFYANAFAGVDLEVSNDHATFTGDTFAGFTGDTYAGSSYGLYLNNVNDATVASSLAEDAGTGIYVYGARDLIGGPNTVDGNTVVSNNTGINVQSSSAVAGDLDTVSYNIVRENYQYGINAGGNVLVSYNNIYNNVNATGILVSDATAFHNQVFANNVGILANSNGAVISDNQVFDNAGIGIHVYWNTLVQGNTVHDNAVGVQGDYLSYPNIPYSGTITNNLIYQNSQDGILLNQAGERPGP